MMFVLSVNLCLFLSSDLSCLLLLLLLLLLSLLLLLLLISVHTQYNVNYAKTRTNVVNVMKQTNTFTNRDYYFVCARGGQHDGHLPFWLPGFVKFIMLKLYVFVCIAEINILLLLHYCFCQWKRRLFCQSVCVFPDAIDASINSEEHKTEDRDIDLQ